MPEAPPSTVRLRKIGKVLRQLREENGHTLKTAGRRLERSGSSLSLIENGQQSLRARDLAFILDAYGVTDPLRQGLLTLAEQQTQTQTGWWNDFKDLGSPSALDYASLESDASAVDTTESSFIPGLLQTEDYARIIIQTNSPEASEAERYVAFRLNRQQILYRSRPTRLSVVIDEAALRRLWAGRDVMRRQLQWLLEVSEHEHIILNVLPFGLNFAPGYTGPFQVIHLGAPPIFSAVLIDHMTGRWILEAEQDIDQYRQRFAALQTMALPQGKSRDHIHGIRSEL